jgi:hypothetical protein
MSEFLKCDAAGCDHRETVGEITADMVGKACPKCGSNLLTEEDWTFFSTVFRPGMHALAAAGLDMRAGEDTPPDQRAAFNYHNGEIRISLPKSPS